MRRILTVCYLAIAATALSGCEQKTWTQSEIEDIADDVASDAISDSVRISELQSRIDELEQKLGVQQAAIDENEALASSVADQVSFNAKVANDNVLTAATKRGACGYQTVYGPGNPPSWVRNDPITCTRKNYFSDK